MIYAKPMYLSEVNILSFGYGNNINDNSKISGNIFMNTTEHDFSGGVLSADGMLPFLSDENTADKINIHASLESTNKTAKELAAAGAKHGTIIMAEKQTAGKGRYGRSFFSPPGHGIYMSVILCPEQRHGSSALLTLRAAVAVCKAIESLAAKKPQIKWVNDIFIDGKKVCGILTEAATDHQNGAMRWAVVGIGVNFDTPKTDYPEELRDIAGSVFSEGRPEITRNRLAAEIINHMTAAENQPGEKEILDEYKKRLIVLGKKVTVAGFDEKYEAAAVDIDDTGRLIVKKDNGEILALSSGEIQLSFL
jgi:BirA family biotin operon repressor/biotin-[acetyl-CoA-carboxylase] ligase